MKIVTFKQVNTVYAKDQEEYQPLPSHKTKEGMVTSCWKLNWWERILVVCTGKVYFSLLTFNQPLQPQMAYAHLPIHLSGSWMYLYNFFKMWRAYWHFGTTNGRVKQLIMWVRWSIDCIKGKYLP